MAPPSMPSVPGPAIPAMASAPRPRPPVASHPPRPMPPVPSDASNPPMPWWNVSFNVFMRFICSMYFPVKAQICSRGLVNMPIKQHSICIWATQVVSAPAHPPAHAPVPLYGLRNIRPSRPQPGLPVKTQAVPLEPDFGPYLCIPFTWWFVYSYLPVVPHKAVAEVSKIGNL